MTDAAATVAEPAEPGTGTLLTFPRQRSAPRVGPIKLCPTCRAELDEGPIVYRCRPCGKAVRAADIDTEYHAPVRAAA